ncbi:MAG: CRTAC1 family protein [Verrucomicrobiales bacterium]|nr:CRTAC1 family protein [Verrucomicrobiales bacterium]
MGAIVLLTTLVGCEPSPRAPTASSTPSPSATTHLPTPVIAPGPNDGFKDVTSEAGLRFVHQLCDDHLSNIIESNGAGGAIFDYDNDGWMDVYLVNSGPLEGVTKHPPGTRREPNRLFRNRHDGTFEDVTEKAGVAGSGYGTAAATADYDNDGDTDLYVVNVGRNLLFRNRGDGTFEEVGAATQVDDPGTGIAAVFVDVDNDGLLDLFVANYLTFDPTYRLYFQPDGFPNALAYKPEFNVLYRNQGDGTFTNISERAGIRIAGHRAMSAIALDIDLDGDQDLYLCNDLSPNSLLLNDGKGRFTDEAARLGVAYNALGEAAGSMGTSVGDSNGDGRPDLLVTRFGYGSLYLADPRGPFSDALMVSGIAAVTAQFVSWGGLFLDFDNDRDLDIFIATGDAHFLVGWQSLLLENRGDGTFADAAERGGAVFHSKLRGRGAAGFDYNNDGRQDLLMTTIADRPFLLKNQIPSDRHWLLIKLEGTRSNRDGHGAIVRVTAKGRTSVHLPGATTGFLMQSDPRIHVGLGDAPVADRIEVRWPSGTVQNLENVPADRLLSLREPSTAESSRRVPPSP